MFRFQNLIPCILNFDECISKFYLFDISREQDNGREQEMLDPSRQMALARPRDVGALHYILMQTTRILMINMVTSLLMHLFVYLFVLLGHPRPITTTTTIMPSEMEVAPPVHLT